MTRREEIEQQASLTVFPWDDVREQSKFEEGFIQGAKWADRTMIEKARQWLINIDFDDYASWDCDFDGNVEYDSIIWNNYSQFEEDIEKFKEFL